MKIGRNLFAVTLFLSFGAAVFGQSIGTVSSRLVYIRSGQSATIAGRGITLPNGSSTPELRDSDGREITWKMVHDWRDPQGRHHVFYRQVLNTPANGPLELYGSEVGVHYMPGDTTARVLGRQFTSVRVVNTVRFPAGEAQRRAIDRLATSSAPTVRPQPYETLPMVVRLDRDNHSVLSLFGRDGAQFSYVYRVLVGDVSGATFNVLLDADTGDVLATERADLTSNCTPTTPLQSSFANGHPVRPGIGLRSLSANHAPDRPRGFTYEGVSNGTPRSVVFQETNLPDFFCTNPNQQAQLYTIFPASMDIFNTPTYIDTNTLVGGDWGGNAAGDALYRSIQTMNAFTSLGRNGWDGRGSDAQVVIRSTLADQTCGNVDSCGVFFLTPPLGDTRVPPGGTVVIAHETALYNFAASLDQVAHEFGHGVHLTSSPGDFGMSSTPTEMKEGWADVIGQMVEKVTEPSGSGIEHSGDWDLAEDLAPSNCADHCYFFSGATDDGPSGHSFGNWTLNNRLHKDDEPSGAGHDRGNMLNVVYRLLSDGGQNAICVRLPSLSGCDVTVPGLGITTASHVVFDTVQFYLPSNSEWKDLAMYTSEAAFDRYSQCSVGNSAASEQDAVDKAFGAIGYPRMTTAETCF